MKKPNKIREARLNKMRSRKNNIRKEKVRLKKIEEANSSARTSTSSRNLQHMIY